MNRNFLKIISILSLTFFIVLVIFFRRSYENVFSQDEQQPIFRVRLEEKKISLTFDMNWAEKDYIYNILDILDKYNVKGTFFIMGKWVIFPDDNVEKLKAIYNAGHEIGNHSYIHPDFRDIGGERINQEVKKTEEIIEETIGVKTELFRFPSGEYNQQALNKVNDLGYRCIQWDVDSIDWKQLGRDIEYERVIKKVKSGSILLFHNNAKFTPENLERIIVELQKDGYKFVPVGELIYSENYYIDKGGEQIRK